jgi:hypothetical protein
MGDFMHERWRQPAVVLHAEDDLDGLMAFQGDPRRFRDAKLTLAPKDVERMRLGRLCIQCLEPFPEAFPQACPVCGFEVRDRQPAEFQRTYAGVEDMRATPSIDREEARMIETNERARSEKRRHSRIWLPGD